MNIKTYLILAVTICVINQISAFNFCNCKDRGIDVCGCKKGLTAPRPYPVKLPRVQKPLFKSICKEHSPSPPQSFNPIGDACHCGQQIVKPAPLRQVRPNCQHQQLKLQFPKPSCSCNSCLNSDKNQNQENDSGNCGQAVRAPEEYQMFANDGATIYFESAKKKQSAPQKPRYAPADVVSIAIAKRFEQSAKNGISEKRLQYGSLKEPTDNQKSGKKQSNVNEELFYDTKGNVLEIQPFIFKEKHESSEEDDSSEEKQKKQKPSAFHAANLNFEDIGYKPYQPSKPRYTVIKNSEPAKHDCKRQPQRQRHHHHRKGESCDCYKDLVVDQSAISEQSMSFESANDHQFNPRFST